MAAQAPKKNSSTMSIASTSTLNVTTDFAPFFQCPNCFDFVLPPILQCQSGHLVCSNCRLVLTRCPVCRGPLGNTRNLVLEKIASTVTFPCKYSSSGCNMSLHHTEKANHEDMCVFKTYSCPCPGASCKWQGHINQVMQHLLIAHKPIATLQGEDVVFIITKINVPGIKDWVMIQSCFEHNFMLVVKKKENYPGHQQFFAIMQLIGSSEQAEGFSYSLELINGKRRLTWEATPKSIPDGIASAIMTSECFVFETSAVKLFEENGMLRINATISKV